MWVWPASPCWPTFPGSSSRSRLTLGESVKPALFILHAQLRWSISAAVRSSACPTAAKQLQKFQRQRSESPVRVSGVMAGEGAKKAEVEATPAAPEAAKDVAEEKAVIPAPAPPADNSKALVVVEKVAEKPHAEKNTQRSSNDRDIALAKVESEKRNSLIKAWEENEKAKAENKAAKKLSAILSWENTKKAAIEAQLKRKEEELEKKRAEYAEKMKNKAAIVHKEAEEKRAMVVARRGEEVLKAEEMAAKYRATGLAPKKLLGCFGA